MFKILGNLRVCDVRHDISGLLLFGIAYYYCIVTCMGLFHFQHQSCLFFFFKCLLIALMVTHHSNQDLNQCIINSEGEVTPVKSHSTD